MSNVTLHFLFCMPLAQICIYCIVFEFLAETLQSLSFFKFFCLSDWLKCCLFVRLYVCVSVCACLPDYKCLGLWRQTPAAVECCSLAKWTVVYTLTEQSLTYTHTQGQCVCCSGRGDTCVTVKCQNICLGNLDGHTHTHMNVHALRVCMAIFLGHERSQITNFIIQLLLSFY